MSVATSLKLPAIGERQMLDIFSDEETIAIGAAFSEKLNAGDVVALYGEMGAGKTTFVRGVCQGLKCAGQATSPTFTLINEYFGKLPVYHFDFYRISNSAEARELGCEEYFGSEAVCLIEWPERISDLLPKNHLEVWFEHAQSAENQSFRKLTFNRK